MLTIVECNVGISNILEKQLFVCIWRKKKIYETQSMMNNLIYSQYESN